MKINSIDTIADKQNNIENKNRKTKKKESNNFFEDILNSASNLVSSLYKPSKKEGIDLEYIGPEPEFEKSGINNEKTEKEQVKPYDPNKGTIVDYSA